ncbi:DUF2061 domain-containing protein [Vibrio cincinnatiensis]|jgi:uncharacterized membrane protein|uniref:Uncharacterized membrane protein n=1 Tax=Vibrio cincinnatiensis DSM 19608 TaxID=1123491 RepID=A0A1T4QHN4_VIBCI|nr:DUF2061 domain-containing protein [Vibrio cincinnatiensis]MCG3721814.1 DUF2061 domain-containing protein [Vibrio cincinnatiensis]MCG3726799.1 DUF2061 domain-containing protein [Vibrio cincinnatiensis]MCG3733721.1 DUF2061 domain-containing protein [Vibrio cincinnatiensis]MCG3737329.1 DUF2061 domain-containing protein [Vibrio cincinnatiensis]MCG3740244.1 DUF2061 domain-containing protein [Vibrio cincinnatiensis]
MKKTLSFAAIHFTIAFTIAYILTGDIILGSLIAMLEPMVNTVAFYFHEKAWAKHPLLQRYSGKAQIKTGSFAVIHFSVAFSIAYLLTGSWLVGGVMAMIEPSFNTCAYYFHERLWQSMHPQQTKHSDHNHWGCAH